MSSMENLCTCCFIPYMTAIVIHGGLNSSANFVERKGRYKASLQNIIDLSYEFLRSNSALDTAVFACRLLEDDSMFNAGTGSVIQIDGAIRMSAALMDGRTKIFSGVINIEKVKNPIEIALALQSEQDRVLASAQANLYAKKHGVPEYDTSTSYRRKEFEEQKDEHKKPLSTVGCVVLDRFGNLAAATSTGGKGWEMPGRVSDSPTVAGNFANDYCAVSCTGIGEDIVSVATASSFVTRVTDGISMELAKEKALNELKAIKGSAGFIAINNKGDIITGESEPRVLWAKADKNGTEIFS